MQKGGFDVDIPVLTAHQQIGGGAVDYYSYPGRYGYRSAFDRFGFDQFGNAFRGYEADRGY